MGTPELLKLTISELAPKIRSREVSPVEVTEAALAQADRLNSSLNSFITLLGDMAMVRAREEEADLARGVYKGPLQGVPIGIKDNLATKGISTTLATKVLLDNVPEEDAHAVRLAVSKGAIVIGKENMEAFAAGATSSNSYFGAVHNPWALDHIPGGSSGGGGANVAACVTFASLGTDVGGSVRLPGSLCGVVGLKQTFGLVSQRGILVTSFNGDHVGPLTRSVRDSALVLQAIAGHDPLDPSTVPVQVPDYSAALEKDLRGTRVGIPANYFGYSPKTATCERMVAWDGRLGALDVNTPRAGAFGEVRVVVQPATTSGCPGRCRFGCRQGSGGDCCAGSSWGRVPR